MVAGRGRIRPRPSNQSVKRLCTLLWRLDGVPRQPSRPYGQSLRAVPEVGARCAGTTRGHADYADGARTLRKLQDPRSKIQDPSSKFQRLELGIWNFQKACPTPNT